MDLRSILRIAGHGPELVNLLNVAKAAADGNPEAQQYIRERGAFDALDLLWRDGAGHAARGIVAGVQELRHGGDVIDGEFREVESDPWAGFVRRLLHQPNGAHIVLGPTGSGKTALATKLASRLSARLGYRVEACNMYAEDCPPFAVTISTDTLVARMKRLSDYLKSLAEQDEEDKNTDRKPPKAMPPQHRIVIIDEAALAMSTAPSDPARRAALQALAECRHLRWHVIYIGQLAGQLPTGLLGQAVVWIKEPGGREFQTDRQNNPAVKDLWTRATEAFDGLRQYEFYKEPWLNRKCWTYCDCQSLSGIAGYVGMLPFLPWSPDEEVAEDDSEVEPEETSLAG